MPTENFYPRPVSDFITKDEGYVFDIPSFQRGYRWTAKQVKDLLKDLSDFAGSKNTSEVYYLQPLVVRGENKRWEVLDGQQRLTTLRLILEEIKKYGRPILNDYQIYKLNYLQRPNFDFFNANPSENMDSFYVHAALKTIREWMATQNDNHLGKIADILFGFEENKNVKFIWYQVDGEDSSESGAISIFNRLNRGKIKLTPSELIKALLLISSDKTLPTSAGSETQTVTSMEWNEMERQFLKDDFFSFINDRNKSYETRTDLLFNHVARINKVEDKDNDADFAYRWFQDIFDSENGDRRILELWDQDIKDTYDLVLQWYADPKIYNYIGFLSFSGDNIKHIVDSLAEEKRKQKEKDEKWYKEDTLKHLRKLIKEKFNFLIKNENTDYLSAIEETEYNESSNEKENIRKILLLFNVESYSKRNLRFPFDKFIDETWDIEHVDSQTLNQLTKNDDQKKWLEYCREVLDELNNPHLKDLSDDITSAIKNDYNTLNWNKSFQNLAPRILQSVKSANPVVDKDSIGNLTLLDAVTNRGYGNALFPYKRKKIIDREQNGKFVPMCTRDLFLKYYTANDGETAGMNRITWSENDAKAYLKEITKTLTPFFK